MQRLPENASRPQTGPTYLSRMGTREARVNSMMMGKRKMTTRSRYPASMETTTRMMLPTIAKLPNRTPRRSLMMRGILARRSIPRGSPTRTKRRSAPPTAGRVKWRRRRILMSLKSPSSSGCEMSATRSSVRTQMRPITSRASF